MVRALIVDDEPLALDILEDFISKVPFMELAGRCENALDAAAMLNKDNINLLFLDIKMPDITGIQLLKSLKNPPVIIFTTAYSDYALEGYSLDVLDYLLKPISFERFLKAANKANDYLAQQAPTAPNEPEADYIFVKTDYKIIKINFSDILFLEGLKDYIKIYTVNTKPILTLQSLKHFEAKLPTSKFIRIHRSYIISLQKIGSITKNRVVIGDKYLPISDSFKDPFFDLINKNI
jgi:DNA-binding LytR/AlgR family response regulator